MSPPGTLRALRRVHSRVGRAPSGAAVQRGQREVGGQVGAVAAGADPPVGDRPFPGELPRRQPQPGGGVGLHDVGRRPAGVPRPGHQLDGDVRGHPQLDRAAGHLLGQPAGRRLHRRTQHRPRGLLGLPRQPGPHRVDRGPQLVGRDRLGRHQLVGTVPAGTLPTVASGVPNRAGRVALQAARSSASGSSATPSTASTASGPSPPVVPSSVTRTPAHSAVTRTASGSVVVTTTRAADSLNSAVNTSPSRVSRAPVPYRSADSASACARPPSARSCAEVTRPSRPSAASSSPNAFSAGRSTAGGRPPRWPWTTLAQAEPPNSGRVVPSSRTVSPAVRQPVGTRVRTSSCTPRTPMTGVGLIASSPVWLYRLTLPPVTGRPRP